MTRSREGITNAGRDALARVGGYLRGTTVSGGHHCRQPTTSSWFVLGTPLALSLAMLVFLGGYIPYFGGAVTTLIVAAGHVLGAGLGGRDCAPRPDRNPQPRRRLRDPAEPVWQDRQHPSRGRSSCAACRVRDRRRRSVCSPRFRLRPSCSPFRAAAIEVIDPHDEPELPALVPAWLDRLAQITWRSPGPDRTRRLGRGPVYGPASRCCCQSSAA